MLDVMLIDDDPPIREYLRNIIEWDNLGLRLVCEAGDSETAKELFYIYRPRIIVTDINIPTISGLELAKELSQIDSNLYFIVITGFGDFDNVRDSLSLGVVDLLPKPIIPNEMNQSLQKAIHRFEEKQRAFNTNKVISDLLKENRTTLQQQFISHLMEKEPVTNEPLFKEYLDLLGLSYNENLFAVVQVDLPENTLETISNITYPLIFHKILIDKFTAQSFRVFSFFNSDNRLNCLVAWSFEKGEEQIELLLTELYSEIKLYFQKEFFAGIGGTVSSLKSIHVSAKQASMALHFRDTACTNVVHYNNMRTLTPSCVPNSTQILEQLAAHIQVFSPSAYSLTLNQWFSSPEMQSSIECRQKFALEFLTHMTTCCYADGIYPWQEMNYPQTISDVLNAKDSTQLQQLLIEIGNHLIALLFQNRTQSKNQLIQLAKRYIQENLNDVNLSVSSVSTHIGLSNNYFSQLFHREEQISFSAYLNLVRVEEAKKLLGTTSKKVFEISEMVGFNNAKHFNYVFKRVVGVTPLDWRQKINFE